MKLLKNIKKYAIFLILVLGFVLRFYRLADFPHALNRDELAIGYNAYSILKTQMGEHGEGPWPMNFISFGDYKMPGHIYLVFCFIKFFGRNNFAVRLPTVILGSLSILWAYLLILKIFPKRKKIAIFTSLFLAAAPYHIHYSRTAYEVLAAFSWQLLGTLILLGNRKSYLKLFALLFFLMSMFTYNSPIFIILPLCITVLYFYRREFFEKKAVRSTILFLLGLFVVYGAYFIIFQGANEKKSEATIFTREDYTRDINTSIDAIHKNGLPIWVARIFSNKITKSGFEFSKRYFSIFNPSFLFFGGDKEPFSDLSIADIPNLYPYLLPLFLIGLYSTSRGIKLKENRFLLAWFLVSGITSGFVNVSPNTTKLMDFNFLIIVISAVGFYSLSVIFKKHIFKIAIFLNIVLFISVLHFLIFYFNVFPKKAPKEWLPDLDKVIEYVKTLDYDYEHFFIQRGGKMALAYINFAFYEPFDPADFAQNSYRSVVGFKRAESYNKYIFDNPPHTRSLKEYNSFISKYGPSLCLSEYEFKPYNWETIKIFYYKGEPLWILEKRY